MMRYSCMLLSQLMAAGVVLMTDLVLFGNLVLCTINLDSFDSMDSNIFMSCLTTWSLKIMNLVSSGFDWYVVAICNLGYLFMRKFWMLFVFP